MKISQEIALLIAGIVAGFASGFYLSPFDDWRPPPPGGGEYWNFGCMGILFPVIFLLLCVVLYAGKTWQRLFLGLIVGIILYLFVWIFGVQMWLRRK